MERRQVPSLVRLVNGETVVRLIGDVDLSLPVAGYERI